MTETPDTYRSLADTLLGKAELTRLDVARVAWRGRLRRLAFEKVEHRRRTEDAGGTMQAHG